MYSLLKKISSRLSFGGAVVSAILFLALVALIMTEIIGRSFFDYSTMLADEYSGYFYLAAMFLGMAYTFDQDGHIRITIVTSRLDDRAKRWADIVAGVLTFAMLLFALYYSWNFMMESKEMEMVSEGVSETPLWLTQIPIVAGLGIFSLSVFVFVLRRFRNDI